MKSGRMIFRYFQFQRGTQPPGKQKKRDINNKETCRASKLHTARCAVFSDVLIDSSCTKPWRSIRHQVDGIPFHFVFRVVWCFHLNQQRSKQKQQSRVRRVKHVSKSLDLLLYSVILSIWGMVKTSKLRFYWNFNPWTNHKPCTEHEGAWRASLKNKVMLELVEASPWCTGASSWQDSRRPTLTIKQ